LIPIWTTRRAAEEAGFEVRDLENLREHYFLTLYHWLRNLEASQEQAAPWSANSNTESGVCTWRDQPTISNPASWICTSRCW